MKKVFQFRTVHLELKHLSSLVDKTALMTFNQKGLDFLLADNPVLRRRPLYRVLLSVSSSMRMR